MKQLPDGHNIVQRRLGSDFVERHFAQSRSKNAHATAQGTDGQMANIGGQVIQNLAQSRKANTFHLNDIYRRIEHRLVPQCPQTRQPSAAAGECNPLQRDSSSGFSGRPCFPLR